MKLYIQIIQIILFFISRSSSLSTLTSELKVEYSFSETVFLDFSFSKNSILLISETNLYSSNGIIGSDFTKIVSGESSNKTTSIDCFKRTPEVCFIGTSKGQIFEYKTTFDENSKKNDVKYQNVYFDIEYENNPVKFLRVISEGFSQNNYFLACFDGEKGIQRWKQGDNSEYTLFTGPSKRNIVDITELSNTIYFLVSYFTFPYIALLDITTMEETAQISRGSFTTGYLTYLNYDKNLKAVNSDSIYLGVYDIEKDTQLTLYQHIDSSLSVVSYKFSPHFISNGLRQFTLFEYDNDNKKLKVLNIESYSNQVLGTDFKQIKYDYLGDGGVYFFGVKEQNLYDLKFLMKSGYENVVCADHSGNLYSFVNPTCSSCKFSIGSLLYTTINKCQLTDPEFYDFVPDKIYQFKGKIVKPKNEENNTEKDGGNNQEEKKSSSSSGTIFLIGGIIGFVLLCILVIYMTKVNLKKQREAREKNRQREIERLTNRNENNINPPQRIQNIDNYYHQRVAPNPNPPNRPLITNPVFPQNPRPMNLNSTPFNPLTQPIMPYNPVPMSRPNDIGDGFVGIPIAGNGRGVEKMESLPIQDIRVRRGEEKKMDNDQENEKEYAKYG